MGCVARIELFGGESNFVEGCLMLVECHNHLSTVAYRGGVWGLQSPPEIPKDLQNHAKLNPICENC